VLADETSRRLLRGLAEKIFFLKQKKETHKKKALSIPSYFMILLCGTSCGRKLRRYWIAKTLDLYWG